MKPTAEYLFEASWEVCNKVGGIYTVVKSKAARMQEQYKNYFLIGPYFEEHAKVEFEKKRPPTFLERAFKEVEKQGIHCHYGKWLIEGEPDCILVDFSEQVQHKDEIKKILWEEFNIDSLTSAWEYEEPVIWSWSVGKIIEAAYDSLQKKRVVLHAHEWLAGAAILYLKWKQVPVATTFTTHATMLGRSIAGSGEDLYEKLGQFDPFHEAQRLGVSDKFLTERATAAQADIFTTVSEITGLEAEYILGRKPEVLVFNGLDISKFPTMEDVAVKHTNCREKIREFLEYHFFPYYHFPLEHNLIFFTVGRYEFRNKGLDMYIQALGELNNRLKQEQSERTISAFVWVPAGHQGIRVDVLKNKNYYRHIKNHVKWHGEKILKNITSALIASGDISKDDILSKEFLTQMKQDYLRFKKGGTPPLSTHYMDENDAIISAFRSCGLNNAEEDKVKVILYPVYLDGNDNMINLPYYDAMAGCHLGVFASYYEPWGYTPLEAGALGVPSITTDLAGFGRYVEGELQKRGLNGITVVDRLGATWEEQVGQLAGFLHEYATMDRQERVKLKGEAKELAEVADWGSFVERYVDAHNQAGEKVWQ